MFPSAWLKAPQLTNGRPTRNEVAIHVVKGLKRHRHIKVIALSLLLGPETPIPSYAERVSHWEGKVFGIPGERSHTPQFFMDQHWPPPDLLAARGAARLRAEAAEERRRASMSSGH